MASLVRQLLDRAAGQRPAATVPLPRRGDAVEVWLKQQRDEHGWHGTNDRARYELLDQLLDDYRLHADTGTPLHEHACEGSFCEHDEETSHA